jgi:hypothetical protein
MFNRSLHEGVKAECRKNTYIGCFKHLFCSIFSLCTTDLCKEIAYKYVQIKSE